MDCYTIAAGAALPIRVNLLDGDGQPLAYSSPGPVLDAALWPGGNRASSFAVAAQWVAVDDGTADLSITAAQTAGLAEGLYQGSLYLTDPTLGRVEAYQFRVDVRPSPGSASEPPSYCGYGDMLVYGRTWLAGLQSDDDEAGFAEQRGRARSWLDEMIVAATPNRVGRGYGLGTWGGWGYTSNYLRTELAAGRLIRRDWVAECTAKKALSLVCETQVGPTDGAAQYVSLGRRLAAEARTIALAHHAEFADAAGNVVFAINLAGGSFR